MNNETYLTNLPTTICNLFGLSKVLLTRRDTIRLKHLQKNIFIYNTEDDMKPYFDMMNLTAWSYMEFLTNQLRGIYKYPREFEIDNSDGGCDKIVKQKKYRFHSTLNMYKKAHPIIVLDFDRVITSEQFHDTYRKMIEDKYIVFINSANPNENVIESYLIKHQLPMPENIFANKGKKAKIVNLKQLKTKFHSRPFFYIDDEDEYLIYGNLLFMMCYKYAHGQIRIKSIYKK